MYRGIAVERGRVVITGTAIVLEREAYIAALLYRNNEVSTQAQISLERRIWKRC
jgi:hypothetical protein